MRWVRFCSKSLFPYPHEIDRAPETCRPAVCGNRNHPSRRTGGSGDDVGAVCGVHRGVASAGAVPGVCDAFGAVGYAGVDCKRAGDDEVEASGAGGGADGCATEAAMEGTFGGVTGDWETGRRGDEETGRLGDWEAVARFSKVEFRRFRAGERANYFTRLPSTLECRATGPGTAMTQ